MKDKGKPKLPRGTMPPPTKKFKDKKKDANKKACRQFKRKRKEEY